MSTVGEGLAPYDARSITILPGLQAVRRNPSLYVGSTGADGLHQLVDELLDNAVDEATAGFCTEISVVVHVDGSCSVTDDGRGIPIDRHPEADLPACEVLLTTLHSGGKFDRTSYATSAGLHGVGLSCVNALSEWLWLDVWRDGGHHRQGFARGDRATTLARVEDSAERGTRVWFKPDPSVLDAVDLSSDTIVARLDEIAYLRPSLRLRFRDERSGRQESFEHRGGVRELLDSRYGSAAPVHAEPIVITATDGQLSMEAALRWTEGYTEEILGYVNVVRTRHGGSHTDGLRVSLTKVINEYAAARGLLDGLTDATVTMADILEGLNAVISVRMAEPKFDGQIKTRLRSPEAARFVEAAVGRALHERFAADEVTAGQIVARALNSARARLAARLAGRGTRFQLRQLDVDYEMYRRQFGVRSKNWHESCSWLADDGLLARHAGLADVPAGSRMLDVCCGSGVVGAAFADRVGEKVGLDITPEMVALASQRLDQVHLGTVYDMPFEDDSFDLVVNREVLHLLPGPERPVAEIYRVLRPGGQFIVGQIVPYADEDAFWMFRIFKKKQPLLHQMFREEDFRRLLLGAGFTDLRVEEYFLWESIDLWIDTHETTPAARQQILRLFYEAPTEVRAVHPFEVGADGSVRDRWRWCVYSLRKPIR